MYHIKHTVSGIGIPYNPYPYLLQSLTGLLQLRFNKQLENPSFFPMLKLQRGGIFREREDRIFGGKDALRVDREYPLSFLHKTFKETTLSGFTSDQLVIFKCMWRNRHLLIEIYIMQYL